MVELNTGTTQTGVGPGETWPTGSLGQGTDGVLGVAGEGTSYIDQLSAQGTPYSDGTTSPSGYFVYTTTSGLPVLYPASVQDNQLLNNPLNDLITPDLISESLSNFVTAAGNQSDPATMDTTRYDNIVVTDPQVLAYAEANGVSPGYVQANVSITQSYVFNQQLAGLPKEEADQLQFAYLTGSSANLTPELKAKYDAIMGQVAQGVRDDFGFTSDWKPTETASLSYQSTVAADYGNLVENALDAAVANGTITEDDAATMRTAFYDSSVTLSPELQTVLTGIKNQATTDLQAKYGFSSTWQPVPDTASYMLMCNGDFATTYQSLCNSYIGDDVSEADQALLEAYFANPNDPSIPQRIKDLATSILQTRNQLLQYFDNPDDPSIPDSVKTIGRQLVTEATNTTIAKFNLSTDWTPTITSLTAAGIDPATWSLAQGALTTMTDLLGSAETVVNQMPEGPQKMIYLNFLRQIGQAILDLQEAIGEMQVAKTEAEKQAANAKLNSALDNFKIQQEAAEAMKEKQDKMAGTGGLDIFLNVLTKLTMLVVGICMGPVVLLMTVLYIADTSYAEDNGTTSLLQQLSGMISEWTDSIGPGGQAILGTGFQLVMATVISVATMNVFVMVNLYTQDFTFVEDFVLGCGGSETDAMICNLVFTVVVQITLMVVMCIMTGGLGAAGEIGGIIAKVAEVLGKSIEFASRVVKAAAIALQIVMASLQVSASGVSLNNNVLLAQIDMIKGRAESRSEEIDAMIQLLQQLINKLLEMLNGDSSWYMNLSNFNGQKWADASQTLTELHG